MNGISNLSVIIAAVLGLMTTLVSWKVLRDHSTLDNPVISICAGLLSFIGLLNLPAGLKEAIFIGYIALAISILFVLLLVAFQKVRPSRFLCNLYKTTEKQIYRPHKYKRNIQEIKRRHDRLD